MRGRRLLRYLIKRVRGWRRTAGLVQFAVKAQETFGTRAKGGFARRSGSRNGVEQAGLIARRRQADKYSYRDGRRSC